MKNGNSNHNHTLDADVLREVLGYSVRFGGKTFCIVVDAESFEQYDSVQLAHDILLVAHSRDTKVVVVVGCFPNRLKGGKKTSYPQKIAAATKELQRQLANIVVAEIGSAKPVKTRTGFLLPGQVPEVLQEDSVAVVPALIIKDSEPVGITTVDYALDALTKSLNGTPISKVVIISTHDRILGADKGRIDDISSDDMKGLLERGVVGGELAVIARTAVHAIDNLSIKRVHIINGQDSGNLLAELFTKDGSGTMIYSGQYSEIRQATTDDVSGIHSLLAHYADLELVLPQTLEAITSSIDQFFVAIVDGFPIACARLRFYPEEEKAFLSSVAVNPAYHGQGVGLKLLEHMIQQSAQVKVSSLLLVSRRTVSFWMPLEFKPTDIGSLPEEIQKQYAGKNPTVLMRKVL